MRIKIDNLSKSIKKVFVLSNICLEFESGKIYGIIGKNGSGKSMLLRAIAGLIVPTCGTIIVDQAVLHKDIAFPNNIGILIEKPTFLGSLSGFTNLCMLAEIRNTITKAEIAELMQLFELDPNSKKPVNKYSQGMRQKLGIIQAIMEKPSLLILDEPFNALDERSVMLLHSLLKRYRNEGKLIIITSHHKDDIDALCDHTYHIVDGTIC